MSTLDNLINISFSTTEINKIEHALDTIEQILNGKVINLTPDERRQYGSIGNHTENWIKKIEDYMNEKPQLIPFYLNKTEFDTDVKARNDIKPWLRRLRSVQESMEDTGMLLSFDIYNAAIAYYRSIKLAASQNVPGSTTIFTDLKDQFPGRPSEVMEEPMPEQPETGAEESQNPIEGSPEI